MLYFPITSREDYTILLEHGFKSYIDPWVSYTNMKTRYGDDAAVDITHSNKSIMYASKKYYIDKGYQCGTIEDLKRFVKAK